MKAVAQKATGGAANKKGYEYMSKNRILLTICGTDCAISSDDDEGYIRSIGAEVDKAMTGLLSQNSRISVTMAAIITALNYCDAAHKSTGGADNLRSQIKDYLEDSSRARMEAEESRREIERLKRELGALRARLSEQEAPAEDAAVPAVREAEVTGPASPQTPGPQTGSFTHPHAKAQKGRQSGKKPDSQEFMRFFEQEADER